MKSKILIPVLIASLGFLAWSAYPIIRNRYFNSQKIEIIPLSPEEEIIPGLNGATTETEALEEIDKKAEEQRTLKEKGKILQEITRDNCDAECEDFSGVNLEYCQQVCGLKPAAESPTGCESESGIQKDYCYKDLGIAQKDFKICEKIADANVKKTCQNRVTEDLLDAPRSELE